MYSTALTKIIIISTITIVVLDPSSSAFCEKNVERENQNDDAGYKKYLIYPGEKRTPSNLLLPVNFYFNSAFDSAQVPTAFKQHDYFGKYEKVINKTIDPIANIKKDGGFKKFFLDEWTSTRAVPNYLLHVIGGGYDFRMIAEWYTYNGIPAAYFLSFLTCYLAHFSNEALETSNKNLTSHDHIADLYFFDVIGKLLFMSDAVTIFFHDFFQLRNWMGQPMFDVRKTRIYNASCNYVIRPFIYKKMVRFFFMMGYHELGGVGFRVNDTDWITFCAGVAIVKGFNPDRQRKGADAVKNFRTCGAIFYDRNGNLLASLILNGTENYKMRLNIYPDLLNIDHVNFGLFLGVDDYNKVAIGLTMSTLLVLSVT